MELQYEPKEHRFVKRPASFTETMLYLYKATLGTGIFAMPKAFSYAGYIIGIIGTILIGLLCTYCMRLLVTVQYELCRRKRIPFMTYTDTAIFAFQEGPDTANRCRCVHSIAQIVLIGFQLGSVCIYMNFIAFNIGQVIEQNFRLGVGERWYLIVAFVLALLLALVNSFKFLILFSYAGDLAVLISYGIIFYYIFTDVEMISQRSAVGYIKDYPLFLCIVIFALQHIAAVLPLENEMKDPEQFVKYFGVLNVTLLPLTVLYTVFGFMGYLKYGDNLDGSITLTLPVNEPAAQACKILISFSILIRLGSEIFIAYDIIWKAYCAPLPLFQPPYQCTFGYQYLIRVMVICLTFFFAAAIPSIDLFTCIVGAIFLATAGIAFPALFNLLCYWYNYFGTHFIVFLVCNLLIISFGICVCVTGVSLTLANIIRKLYSS